MHWIDAEAAKATTESYGAALRAMLEVCPRVERTPYGQGYLPVEFAASYGAAPLEKLLAHATGMSGSVGELFDFMRPKVLEKHLPVVTSSFFTVNVWADFRFQTFEWRPGTAASPEYTDEDGVHPARPAVPAKMEGYDRTVRLRLTRRSWGLNVWRKGEQEAVRDWINPAPEAVRKQYLALFERAERDVARWREATQRAREESEALAF